VEEGTEVWTDPGLGNGRMSLLDLTGTKGGWRLDNDGARTRTGSQSCVRFSMDGAKDDGGREKSSRVRFQDEESSSTTTTSMTSQSVVTDTSYETVEHFTPVSPKRRLSKPKEDHLRSLDGRGGRKETCIVNASIMARSFGSGPKRFNKPIVVDLDLPIWQGDDAAEETTTYRRQRMSSGDRKVSQESSATTSCTESYDSDDESGDSTPESDTDSADTIHNTYYRR